MSELDDLLAEERARAERRGRMPRAALVLAGAGLVVALGAGGALAVSATASVAEAGLGGGEGGSGGSARAADVVAVDPLPTGGSGAGTAAPVEGATDGIGGTDGFGNDVGLEGGGEVDSGVAPETGAGMYDASTDLATIPRPPADWSQSELDNAEVWLTQQGIVADCMLEKGFDYEFVPWWLATPDQLAAPSWGYGAHIDQAAWLEALDGPPDRGLGEDYDWREAGCYGYAVHVTGMDDAH